MTHPLPESTRVPAAYLGHGAPPIVDDPIQPGERRAMVTQRPVKVIATNMGG